MLAQNTLESLWSARDSVIKDDRSMLSLTSSQGGITKDGFEEVVLNDPAVLYDTAVGMLSTKVPMFSIPMKANLIPEEKGKIGKAERFIGGILEELDTQHFREGKGQWIRELAYWVCSGWVCIFPSISVDGVFRADFYDPLTIYPLWVQGKLKQVMRKVLTTGGEVKAFAEMEGLVLPVSLEAAEDDAELELINMWEDRGEEGIWNWASVGGAYIKEETKENVDRIPFLIGLSNGSPERDASDWRKNVGKSIISTNKTMYEEQNRWVSMMMQIAAQRAFPTLLTTTPSGESILEKKDLGHSNVVPLRSGEDVKPLESTAATPEINILNSILSGSVQRGGLPHVIYGGLPFELSGFALSQMISAVNYKLSPYVVAMQQVLSQLAVEFIDLFKKYGKDIDLNIKDKESGKHFIESFSRDEIPQITRMEVTIDVGGPQDKLQQLLSAKAALQEPAVLSRETMWRMIVPDVVEDPIAETQRILEDQAQSLPVVRMIRIVDELRVMAESLQNEGKGDNAKIIMGYAQTILNSITSQIQQQGQGQQQQGGNAGGAGQRGGGQPSPEAMNASQGGPAPSGGQAGQRGQYQSGGMTNG